MRILLNGALGALLLVLVQGPVSAQEPATGAKAAPSVERPAPSEARSLTPPGVYPKGGLSASDARKGYKPSFGAKPYRYFGRHGYGKAGISRFGQGKARN